MLEKLIPKSRLGISVAALLQQAEMMVRGGGTLEFPDKPLERLSINKSSSSENPPVVNAREWLRVDLLARNAGRTIPC